MKILLVSQTFPLNPNDSTAHFMLDFAQGFIQLGHEVIVVLPFNPNLQVKAFTKIKLITFKYVWPDSFHLLGFGNSLKNDQQFKWFVYFLSPLFFLFEFLKLLQVTLREKPNVTNAHWILPNGFIAAIVSKITKTPLFITLPGSDVYISQKNLLFRLITKFTLNNTFCTISNSLSLLNELKIKGRVISYPVPLNLSVRVTQKKLQIATAGRLVEKKGIHILKKFIPEIEVLSNLPIKKLRQELLSVDIFIAYSIKDSQGNIDDASVVVLEAMAAGCSVIATDLLGYRRIIKNKEKGLLVTINNQNTLLQAVDVLRKSKALRRQLGRAARKTIAQKFTPQKIAQQYLTLFESANIATDQKQLDLPSTALIKTKSDSVFNWRFILKIMKYKL